MEVLEHARHARGGTCKLCANLLCQRQQSLVLGRGLVFAQRFKIEFVRRHDLLEVGIEVVHSRAWVLQAIYTGVEEDAVETIR